MDDISVKLANEMIYFGIAFHCASNVSATSENLVERFAARKTGRDLRNKLVDAIFYLGQRFVQTNGTGHLVTLSIEGIEKIKTYIEMTIPRMIRSVSFQG